MEKKVLFLITKATQGGAQKYVFHEAKRAQAEGRSPIVAYGVEGRLAQELKEARIETHRIPSLARDVAFISDIESFLRIFRDIGSIRPNEVHLNSSKAAALGALAAKLRGVQKVIFTVHGWPFKEDRNFFARTLIYFVSWLTAILSHEVIVVSRSDAEIGKRMWGVSKKIHYVPLHINPPQFVSRDEAATRVGIRSTAPRIVTIAELTKNKGHRFALEAIAELEKNGTHVEYYIIGEGEERTALESGAKELGIKGQVHLLGFIQDAAKYLKAFDIFLLPSIKEGMPYVLLEAAQASLPIITTNVIDPEFLEKNPSVVHITPSSPKSITGAVEQMLQARH